MDPSRPGAGVARPTRIPGADGVHQTSTSVPAACRLRSGKALAQSFEQDLGVTDLILEHHVEDAASVMPSVFAVGVDRFELGRERLQQVEGDVVHDVGAMLAIATGPAATVGAGHLNLM